MYDNGDKWCYNATVVSDGDNDEVGLYLDARGENEKIM